MPRSTRNRKKTATSTTTPSENTGTHAKTALPTNDTSPNAANKATLDSQPLQNIMEIFESFRNDLTCKICFRLLYEPFMNPCGHAFCYSCLSQWFNDNPLGKSKPCPDCRAPVNTQPAPAYLIRELTSKLIQHLDMLNEDGETRELHEKLKAEEASIVEMDRLNQDPDFGGLFKGCFKHVYQPRFGMVRDVEDGVDRCPNCTWEVEDDAEVCDHCGYLFDDEFGEGGPYPETSDDEEEDQDSLVGLEFAGIDEEDASQFEDEDIDEDLAIEDSDALLHQDEDASMEDVTGHENVGFRAVASSRHHDIFGSEMDSNESDESSASSSTARADVEDDDSDDQSTDESMDGFIDDDGSVDGSTSEESDCLPQPRSRIQPPLGRGTNNPRRCPHIVTDSDDDMPITSSHDSGVVNESDDDDDDDEPPIVRRAQVRRRRQAPSRRRPVEIEDED